MIEGYVPLINYEKAGFPLRIQFTCTAPLQRRSDLAERALEIANVVCVEGMPSATEVVGFDRHRQSRPRHRRVSPRREFPGRMPGFGPSQSGPRPRQRLWGLASDSALPLWENVPIKRTGIIPRIQPSAFSLLPL